jgi:hypothetical protein
MGASESFIVSCPACTRRLRLRAGPTPLTVTCPSCRHQWVWPARASQVEENGVEQDYYELLQVSAHADVEVIEAAYRRLAQRYHPDRNPGDKHAATMMTLLNQAKEVVTDPLRRAEYDRTRERQARGRSNPQPNPTRGRSEPPGSAAQSSSDRDQTSPGTQTDIGRPPSWWTTFVAIAVRATSSSDPQRGQTNAQILRANLLSIAIAAPVAAVLIWGLVQTVQALQRWAGPRQIETSVVRPTQHFPVRR